MIVLGSSLRARYNLANHESMTQLIVPVVGSSFRVGHKSNQEVINYFHNICVTTNPMAISCLGSGICNRQDSRLSETVVPFYPPGVCSTQHLLSQWMLVSWVKASRYVPGWFFSFTTQVCGVFWRRVLPLSSGEYPRAITITCNAWEFWVILLTNNWKEITPNWHCLIVCGVYKRLCPPIIE